MSCSDDVCCTAADKSSTLHYTIMSDNIHYLLPSLWGVIFGRNTLGLYSERRRGAFLARCVFAPWLHRGSFISPPWMVSRQASRSGFCVGLPVLSFSDGSKEKVAVKATPLPPLQPPRSFLKMRSGDTRALGEPPSLFLFERWRRRLRAAKEKLLSDVKKDVWIPAACFEIMSFFKTACVLSDDQTCLAPFFTYRYKWKEKEMCVKSYLTCVPCNRCS